MTTPPPDAARAGVVTLWRSPCYTQPRYGMGPKWRDSHPTESCERFIALPAAAFDALLSRLAALESAAHLTKAPWPDFLQTAPDRCPECGSGAYERRLCGNRTSSPHAAPKRGEENDDDHICLSCHECDSGWHAPSTSPAAPGTGSS